MLPNQYLFGNEKRIEKKWRTNKSQQGALNNFLFKKVDIQENLDNNVNENLDQINKKLDHVSNAPNIENLGDEISHFIFMIQEFGQILISNQRIF